MISDDGALNCELDKFIITPGATVDPGNTNHVPGIIVTTGEGVQLSTEWLQNQILYDPDFATLQNTHRAEVTMGFLCLHFDPDMVARISDEVLALVVSSELLLRQAWEWLIEYQPKGQTSPKLARKATDQDAFENYYEATVNLQLVYQYSTITRIESRRMQDYDLVGRNEVARSVDVTSESS